MTNNIAQQIEALLFATADPYTVKSLASRLGVPEGEISAALDTLTEALSGHGIMLVREGAEVTLATRGEHAALIETVRKEELSKELSKASAETLAIVAYRPGISKPQIEFIRGVNASYSLRALSMRGLVEARGSGRAVGYYPTLQMLEHFGVSRVEDLPQYADTAQKVAALLTQEAVPEQSS